jgi:hypothetical protein
MTPPKSAGSGSSQSSTATTTASTGGRKPWKKKSPVEVVLDQINRIKDDVAKKEEEFKQAKRQLEKLEAARKVLEAT